MTKEQFIILRHLLCLSRQEFSRLLEVPTSTVVKIEWGEKPVTSGITEKVKQVIHSNVYKECMTELKELEQELK